MAIIIILIRPVALYYIIFDTNAVLQLTQLLVFVSNAICFVAKNNHRSLF